MLRSFNSSINRTRFVTRATGTYSSAPAATFATTLVKHGAALSDKDAVYSRTLGGAQDRTHVVWIFDAIESERQRRIRATNPALQLVQQIIRVRITSRGDTSDNSLMTHVTKIKARHTMNRHAFFTRQVEQRLQTIRARALEYRDRLDLPLAGTQRFEHRVWSIDQIRSLFVCVHPRLFR